MSKQKKGFFRRILESFGLGKRTEETKYVSPYEEQPVALDREMCVLELIDKNSKPGEHRECRLESPKVDPKPYATSFCRLEVIGLDEPKPTSTYVDDDPVFGLESGRIKKPNDPKKPRRKK